MLPTLKVVAVVLIVGYLGVVALLVVMQNRLLYPSAGVLKPLPPANELARAGLEAWPETDPVALLANLQVDAVSPDSARATIVVFHGNGGTALQRGYYADALRSRGLRVVLAEYPAYGWRSGDVSEAELVADARRTLELAHHAFGEPLIVWGESLGAGVASAALRQLDVPVEAAILLTPWDTLPNTAGAAYPWIPVGWLLRDRYDSLANLSGFAGRVAVLVAETDAVIPPARGLALYEGIEAEKRLWTFPDAGHNSWPSNPGAPWWDEVLAFALPGTD